MVFPVMYSGLSDSEETRDALTCQGFDKDLHGTTTQTENQMQRRLLLDVVIRQRTTILKLLACADQT